MRDILLSQRMPGRRTRINEAGTQRLLVQECLNEAVGAIASGRSR